MYGLCLSCVPRSASVQEIAASNMGVHRREYGHVSVELHIVASADV